jgi:hypothetical protein
LLTFNKNPSPATNCKTEIGAGSNNDLVWKTMHYHHCNYGGALYEKKKSLLKRPNKPTVPTFPEAILINENDKYSY